MFATALPTGKRECRAFAGPGQSTRSRGKGMTQRRRDPRGGTLPFRRLALALAAAAVLAAVVSVGAYGGQQQKAAITPPPSPNCHLANGIQHVIELTFDNTHFNRDNPNVLSDL